MPLSGGLAQSADVVYQSSFILRQQQGRSRRVPERNNRETLTLLGRSPRPSPTRPTFFSYSRGGVDPRLLQFYRWPQIAYTSIKALLICVGAGFTTAYALSLCSGGHRSPCASCLYISNPKIKRQTLYCFTLHHQRPPAQIFTPLPVYFPDVWYNRGGGPFQLFNV
jgi:hypothetical protein